MMQASEKRAQPTFNAPRMLHIATPHKTPFVPHGLPPRRPAHASATPAAPAMCWLPPAAHRLARRVTRERRYGPWNAA